MSLSKGAEARQEARGIEEREIKIETKQFQSQFPLLYLLAINPKKLLYQKKNYFIKKRGLRRWSRRLRPR